MRFICFCLIVASLAPAQTLVKDIAPGFHPFGSGIEYGFASGGLVFFRGWTGGGPDLYVTDGTPAGTRRINGISPETLGSYPRPVADLDGRGTVLFVAGDPEHRTELWRTDGTDEGTYLIRDIWPGPWLGSWPSGFWKFGNEWFFSAGSPTGQRAWRTDGTAEGTQPAFESIPGLRAGSNGIDIQGRAVLVGADPVGGVEPWITDRTPAGSFRLADINPGFRQSLPRFFTQVGSEVYFVARATPAYTGPLELWKTDGTVAGTVRVCQFAQFGGRFDSQMVRFGTRVLVATTGGPLVSDGSLAGTLRLPAPPPGAFAIVGNEAFFTAGGQLWKTDGTSAGTTQIVSTYSDVVGDPTALGGAVYFAARDAAHGLELWRSDGTAAGTSLAADINPGPADSEPEVVELLSGGALILHASDPVHGRELWLSGGTQGSTSLLADLSRRGVSSDPRGLTAFGPQLLFSAEHPSSGRELWISDGTSTGTRIVADLAAGTPSSSPTIPHELNGLAYFGASDGVDRLWRTDGTAAGTSPIGDVLVKSPKMTAFGGRLWFCGAAGSTGGELWATDGSRAGTVRIADLAVGQLSSDPDGFTVVGNRMFFRANRPGVGTELFVTDGTPAGTRLVVDIRPGAGSSEPQSLVAFGGELFFVADDGVTGPELWKSDGTAVGTGLVRDIAPANGVAPSSLLVWNGSLYFSADDGVAGSELWGSDGSAAGTTLAVDITPGSAGSSIEILGANSEFIYLDVTVPTPRRLRALWRSDGTPAGTRLIDEVRSDVLSFAQPCDGPRALFSAARFSKPNVWTSDGTGLGTFRVANVSPRIGSRPREFVRVGRTIYFSADKLELGRELWSMDVSAFGGSLATSYGSGCGGSVSVPPEVVASRSPRIGDAMFELSLSRALPNTAAGVVLGTRPGSVPLGGGGCEWLIANPFTTLTGLTNAAGSTNWSVPIRLDRALIGSELVVQGVVVDRLGARGLANLSAGLRLVVGW